MSEQLTLTLPATASRTCPVWIGTAMWVEIAAFITTHMLAVRQLAIISDEQVDALYGDSLETALIQTGLPVHRLTFASGEKSKSRTTKATLEDAMLSLGCGRDTLLLALGGGVTTDLAGFVAATYMRGIPYIQIPTSLLAAADAAIGGKTGINTPAGKNLLGAFYQPQAVFIDYGTWQTLPVLERQNGLAETIKHAMITDAEFFGWLESQSAALQAFAADTEALMPDALALPIARANVRIKSQIVESDEYETGQREKLNFGHTIGHALESASDYALSHGYAVAIGMCLEAQLAQQLGLLDPASYDRLCRLVTEMHLPSQIPSTLPAEAIMEKLLFDKKTRAGQVRYVLPSAIGGVASSAGQWSQVVPTELVHSVILSAY